MLSLFLLGAGLGMRAFAQNVGINTDGTSAETGVMLDVKGPTDKTTTAAAATHFKSNRLTQVRTN